MLSGVYEPNSDVAINADYYYFRADDKEDVGHALNRSTGSFNKYDYVGQNGLDFKNSEADIATVKISAYLSDDFRIENKSRYGETVNEYIVSMARGTGIRSFSGWQENEYIGNQTNFIWDTELFGKKNSIVTGVEYANEKTDTGSYTINQTNSFTLDPYNANNNLWEGSVTRNDATNSLKLQTLSAYIMDTITLSDTWEVHGGVRYDYFNYDADVLFRGNTGATNVEFNDGFLNGHLGVVFSPWEHGNVYGSWSTSSNINGGEVDAVSQCGYGGICLDSDGNYKNAEPEQSTNLELGTKWNLMDHKLLLTAAAFQITKDKVIEGEMILMHQVVLLTQGKIECMAWNSVYQVM
ncbi:TonB-dependent receptor [Marinomonas sp. RS-M-Aa-14]|uniref:TonB-dependent receptor n=1 Tax=Marinomonas sp. RS-M-Aa-14 TaxID=3241169 RepID=UPI003AAFA9F2